MSSLLSVFTVQAYARAVLGVVILSVCCHLRDRGGATRKGSQPASSGKRQAMAIMGNDGTLRERDY